MWLNLATPALGSPAFLSQERTLPVSGKFVGDAVSALSCRQFAQTGLSIAVAVAVADGDEEVFQK